jgi:hypothetical protein
MSRRLQPAENCSHSASVGARRLSGPWKSYRSGGRPCVFLDERAGVELGVVHDGVDVGVAEQGLADVDGDVVVERLGAKQQPAVVRPQDKVAAVGAPGFGEPGELGQPGADR